MNFQEIANSFHAPTGIISVQKKDNGTWGDVRIVAGNQKYLEPIENTPYDSMPDMPFIPENFKFSKKFIPNSIYSDYLPKDIGFEKICYRSAVERMPIHTYIHLNTMNIWFDIFVLPIEFQQDDIYYCSYTVQPSNPHEVGTNSSQSDRMAEDVLKTCIKLHSTNDFKKTIHEVISDIRFVCKAEICAIMLFEQDTETYSILSASIDEKSKIKQISQFSSFYETASSWVNILEDTSCLMIKEPKDVDYICGLNYQWYLAFRENNVKSFILFPLRYDNEVLGFIWVTNFDTENTIQIKEMLELTAYFISSQLSSYKMTERLKQISFTDLLTKLPNRFACSDYIESLIKSETPFVIVSIDINAFKSINETMGFHTGNKVLIEIASRWKTIADNHLSGTLDYISRLNGDEFALIICDYHSDEDIMKTISTYESVLGSRLTIDECDFYITASFGYAVYPEDSQNMDSLLTYANSAMQEIKRQKNSAHILRFTSDLLKIERTLEVEIKIREALENDTIYFQLQPQFDFSHKLRGFEALARMKDSNGNIISPGEFIPVAEKVGLIDKVDGAIYKKSALFIGDLLKKTGANIILSINVSVRHMMKNDFLDEIKNLLKISGIPANQLEIEITESIMIDSAEKAFRCIDEIKKMGIKIAIDDFGTGYSSLSYLNNFPANLLKIDKSFIDKMNLNESSRQYVAAIISMGHIMGFEVISEGVETQEQIDTLRDIGCDFIQGFVWGRPLPKEEAEKLILDSIQN